MSADQDFLERLDAAIGCQHCEGPLTSSVSDYFCSELCSEAYASQRAPRGRTYDYFGDLVDDEHGWTADDLTDLQPVSWIRPPEFRLPRSTGDLEADQAALLHACDTVTTAAQQAACDLRQDDLNARERVIWAREWRLPRSTGTYFHDQLALHEAERTATTDAQRAACKLRRESLKERHPSRGWRATQGLDLSASVAAMPGRQTSWGVENYTFRSPLRDFPIITTEQAQRAANALLAAVDPDYVDATPFGNYSRTVVDSDFGTRARNNLPGIEHGSFQISGRYEPERNRVAVAMVPAPETPGRMLTYELRRDSDNTLLMTYATPYRDGVTFTMTPEPHFDYNGTSMHVLLDGREIARHQIIDSRTRRGTAV